MGFVSPLRSTLPVMETLSQSSTGSSGKASPAAQTGVRAAPMAETETARPVAPSSGAENSTRALAEEAHQGDHTRARVEAAQRAYMMTLRAAGLNPLSNPVP